VRAEAGRISLAHTFVPFNCCSEVRLDAVLDGQILNVGEIITNPDEQCFCHCRFDLSTTISLLPPGRYTVRLWSPEGVRIAEREVDVAGGPLAERLEVRAEGDGVRIRHQAAQIDCCHRVSHHASLKSGTLNVREEIDNPDEECDCPDCRFDVEVLLSGLYEGDYRVVVRDPEGDPLADLPVAVPDGTRRVQFVDGELVHRQLHAACCATAGLRLAGLEGQTLDVEEIVGMPEPCECRCFRDVSAPFVGLDPGVYTARLWTERREDLIGEVTFELE